MEVVVVETHPPQSTTGTDMGVKEVGGKRQEGVGIFKKDKEVKPEGTEIIVKKSDQ